MKWMYRCFDSCSGSGYGGGGGVAGSSDHINDANENKGEQQNKDDANDSDVTILLE